MGFILKTELINTQKKALIKVQSQSDNQRHVACTTCSYEAQTDYVGQQANSIGYFD